MSEYSQPPETTDVSAINGDPVPNHISKEIKAVAAGEEKPLTPAAAQGLTPAMMRKTTFRPGVPLDKKAYAERMQFLTDLIDSGAPHMTIAQQFSERYQVTTRRACKWIAQWYRNAMATSTVSADPGKVFNRMWRLLEKLLERSIKEKDADLQLKVTKDMMTYAGYGPAAARFGKGRPKSVKEAGKQSAKDINRHLQEQTRDGLKAALETLNEDVKNDGT